MSSISDILGQLIQEYYRPSSQETQDTRLIVPGLTRKISEELHNELRVKNDLPSFLVLGEDRKSEVNEDTAHIRPDGLTSYREDSMIIIASPGQVSYIQDSIRGSGSPFKSPSFSEEWPWEESRITHFKFDGGQNFLERLIRCWTTDESEIKWFKSFIVEGLLPATKSEPDRADLLLDNLLGGFDPSLVPELTNVCHRFLFHCGVPMPTDFDVENLDLHKSLKKLTRDILEHIKKPDFDRGELDFSEPSNVQNYVDSFLDGIGRSSNSLPGLRALSSGWQDPPDVERWKILNEKVLRNVFDVPKDTAQLLAKLLCSDGLVSDNAKTVATFDDETIRVEWEFDLETDLTPNEPWNVRLKYRGQTIDESRCCQKHDDGFFEFVFRSEISDAEKALQKRIPLSLELVRDEQSVKSIRLHLHLCGDERPFFSIVKHKFTVFDASKEDGFQNVPVTEPMDLYFFSNAPERVEAKNGNEDSVDLRIDGRVRSTEKPIDPSTSASGMEEITAEDGSDSTIKLEFESELTSPNEFTLEGAIVAQLVLRKPIKSRLRLLQQILEGTSQRPYPHLGGLNEPSALCKSIVRDMEDSSQGCHPRWITTDAREPADARLKEVGLLYVQGGDADLEFLRNESSHHQKVEAHLNEYKDARNTVLGLVKQHIDAMLKAHDRPLYAIAPTFFKNKENDLQTAIVRYLTVSREISEFLRTSNGELEYGEAFALHYLDCVVQRNEDDNAIRTFFMGPWHPLVAATRFMVEASLLECLSDQGSSFNRLATLIHESSGFRWFRTMRPGEPACVTRTSDPGWMLCRPKDALKDGSNPLGDLLGLKPRALLTDPSESLETYLKGFSRAFPSRRALSIEVPGAGRARGSIRSADEYLRNPDRTLTKAGTLLPGGITLHVTEKPPTDTQPVPWPSSPSEPPLLVRVCGNEEQQERITDLDISVLERNLDKEVWTADSKNRSVPRGEKYGAAFFIPLVDLTTGARGTPTSRLYESDTAPDDDSTDNALEAAYLGALSDSINHQVTERSIDLPPRLRTPWTILPGTGIDPGALVKYVRESSQDQALWDYNIDLVNGYKTYYVLSQMPRNFSTALGNSPVIPKEDARDISKKFLKELGGVGIAIGSDAIETSNKAMGVIGTIGAVRLFGENNSKGPFQNDPDCAGFLLPVDSFAPLLMAEDTLAESDELASEESNRKLADLVAIQIQRSNGRIKLSICAIECKYRSGELKKEEKTHAFSQARKTFDQLRRLVDSARSSNMVSRLALAQVVSFGLRVIEAGQTHDQTDCLDRNRDIFAAILSGNIDLIQAECDALLVSTECKTGLRSEISKKARNWRIRIVPNQWPGIDAGELLDTIYSGIEPLFRKVLAKAPETPQPSAEPLPTHEPAPEDVDHSEDVGRSSVKAAVDEPPPSVKTAVDEPPPSVKTAADETPPSNSRILNPILIGTATDGSRVFYDPGTADNMNMMITGSSGKGKTQQIKSIVHGLRQQDYPVCLLDLKNDFASDTDFTEQARLDTCLVALTGLPYNPLIPPPQKQPGSDSLFVDVSSHVSGLASVLKKSFGLGDQQEYALKLAIRKSYIDTGNPGGQTHLYNEDCEYPDFSDVGENLDQAGKAGDKESKKAYQRLDPLFDLGIFKREFQNDRFDRVLKGAQVMDLSGINSYQVQACIARILIHSAHKHYNSQKHASGARQFFVFDEAHRMLDKDAWNPLRAFVRECRAYGVGIILSSQYPKDFPEEISGSLSTKIIHGNDRDRTMVKHITNLLGIEKSDDKVAGLKMFEAFVANQHSKHIEVRTLAYPLYLLAAFLEDQGPKRIEEIGKIAGIDYGRISLETLIDRLQQMGLVEDRNGTLHRCPDST